MKNYIKWHFSLFILILFSLNFVSANNYTVDIFFTVPDTVYQTNERIEIKGSVHLSNTSDNGTLITNISGFENALVNLTIKNVNGTFHSNYTFTTYTNGTFYSKSSYYNNATEINASNVSGDYLIRAEYKDPNNKIWYSELDIRVLNNTVDHLLVGPEKAKYNPSETVKVVVVAMQLIEGRNLYISNVSVNGTLRNHTKGILSSFNCTTGVYGFCIVSLTAPSDYGRYLLELNNFKAFSSFSVVPFSVNVYMKDELGKSVKNVFASGEKARVEVSILNASSTDEYTFSGYIRDASGNVLKTINSTTLNDNNTFINTFQFTIDSLTFSSGAYSAFVTVNKTGDGSINSSTSFEVKDWVLTMTKKSSGSGFEYEHSVFPNRTVKFDVYPTYRSNGSVIKNLSSNLFTVNLKDNLNNVVVVGNISWNESCGNEGCYELAMNSTNGTGQFTLYVTLSNEGLTQTVTRIINVINGILSAQSTDSEGNLKELFGANDYVYFSLTSYNTTSSFNLSDAEIFLVKYMNGSEYNYTNVSYNAVNYSNSVYEWGWNATLQRLRLDVPKTGGVYNVFIFGNNRTVGATSRFIINPYSLCSVPKDTPGSVSSTSGAYYVWQFKTSDTVYFELKITQADNPLGRASALNSSSSNGTSGLGSGCSIDTSTKQVVSNATISIVEVKHLETGALDNINVSESKCKSDDSSGGYTCTVQPLTKWAGGNHIVKFKIEGQDGTTGIGYSRFEARAFYMYGYSTTWQNSPSSNISLNVQLYEAGSGWWGSSSGLSGTVTVKKVEYMGRDGEWIWLLVDSGLNVSNLSASITSGSSSITIPVSRTTTGSWKTGYYRVVMEGKTSSGDTDYGYAWFGVKLWDVYGMPVDCTTSSCNYKSYFNSKENITLYVKISKAGSYSYSYSGGQDIWGNVSIGVKKIQDCRKWPCSEYNASKYSATIIYVNESSPWYWNANTNNQSKFLIGINNTEGSWGTGWWSVVLNVNGTDTGYAWFNTIAFYVGIRPTDINGSNYKYNIKPGESKYYNITITKNYKGWGVNYNESDYVSVTFDDLTLRAWDDTTYQTIEKNYPQDLNVTPLVINGSVLVNISYVNGSWPTGWYWGEIVYRNNLTNETSSGYIYFGVKPFRVNINRNTGYEIDESQCTNVTLQIYEPDWGINSYIGGNYSIKTIYENVWSSGSRRSINLTNYTIAETFNATTNVTLCPNNGTWGSGNWGGYHYINFIVIDNSNNNTASGGDGFRAMPFRIRWGSVQGVSTKIISEPIYVNANVSQFISGASANGNLSSVYQWRYDNSFTGKETYVFSVGSCFSNVSGQCNITGVKNVTIYPNSRGWREGYNYLTTEWNKVDDSSSKITDWSGIYFNAKQAYTGSFSNTNRNGNWKYNFYENDSVTIRITVRDTSNNAANVSITSVSYANTGGNCWSEWCKSYTTANEWSLTDTNATNDTGTSDGSAIILINKPTSNWSKGEYTIKVGITGINGSATVTGGNFRIIDSVLPNITVTSPTVNQTITNNSFSVSWTTTETTSCYLYFWDYNTFYNYYCGAANASNASTVGLTESCNVTKYGFSNNTLYYFEYIGKDYQSASSGSSYDHWWQSGSTGLSTDSTSHSYSFNTSNKVTKGFLRTQNYGLQFYCYDSDYNSVSAYVALKIDINSSNNITAPTITLNSPTHDQHFNTTSVTFNFTLDKAGYCEYSLNNGTANYTMTNTDTTVNLRFNATNSSITDGTYLLYPYCNDTFGNTNYTYRTNFTIDTINPNIVYGIGTVNDSTNLSGNSIYVNVTVNDTTINNVTFRLFYANGTAVNTTTITRTITSGSMGTTVSEGLNYKSINWTGLADNVTYKFNVTAMDKANNKNSTSTITTTINLSDTTNPSLNFTSATSSAGNQSSTSINVTVNVTEVNQQAVVFSLWYTNGSLVNRTQFNDNKTNFNWTDLSDEDYHFNVTVNDTVGNKGASETRAITIDTINPNIDYGIGTVNDSTNLSGNSIYVNVTVNDTNLNNVTFRLFYANGTIVNTTNNPMAIASGGALNYQFVNWTGLSDNVTYKFNVTVRDRANNKNSTSTITTTTNFSDTINPSLNLTVLTTNAGNKSTSFISVEVNATDDHVQAIVFGLWYTNGTLVNRSQFTNNWSNVNWTNLIDEDYHFNVTANDSYGNINTTATRAVTIDTTNPSINYSEGTAVNYANLTQNNTYVNVSVTEINFLNITFRLYYGNHTIVNTTAYTDRIFTINWTNLSMTNYTYNVTIYDAAGNKNATSSRYINLSAA